MVYRGTVREGKIELENGTQLPEGTRVRIYLAVEDWLDGWKKLAREISEASRGQPSAVELLCEIRR